MRVLHSYDFQAVHWVWNFRNFFESSLGNNFSIIRQGLGDGSMFLLELVFCCLTVLG